MAAPNTTGPKTNGNKSNGKKKNLSGSAKRKLRREKAETQRKDLPGLNPGDVVQMSEADTNFDKAKEPEDVTNDMVQMSKKFDKAKEPSNVPRTETDDMVQISDTDKFDKPKEQTEINYTAYMSEADKKLFWRGLQPDGTIQFPIGPFNWRVVDGLVEEEHQVGDGWKNRLDPVYMVCEQEVRMPVHMIRRSRQLTQWWWEWECAERKDEIERREFKEEAAGRS